MCPTYNGPYDFVLGRDYMHRYGINLKFSNSEIEFDGKVMPMQKPGFYTSERAEDLLVTVTCPEVDKFLQWMT